MVLSELAYIDFKPVFKEGEEFIPCSLREAVLGLSNKHCLKNTRASSGKEDEEFALLCAASNRFGNVKIIGFKDIYDSSDRQFAAITYLLDDGTTAVAFRGTDATIIGWKEDFMISYTRVPSQELALDYAVDAVRAAEGDVLLMGHSKGAHLALYSAAHLEGGDQKKLKRVYMNDGPGFCDDVLDRSYVYKIAGKITRISPEYSIVGRIFEFPVEEDIVVRSSAKAMLQHSMQTWLIEANGPVCVNDHSPESHLIKNSISKFLDRMDLNARENFVDTLFTSMTDTGAETIKDFAAQGPAAFEDLVFKMAGNDAFDLRSRREKINEEDDKNLSFFERFWGLINRKEVIRIILTLVLSALCFIFPDFAMETVVFIVLLVLTVYEVVLTLQHLKKSEWNFRMQRPRIMVSLTFVVLTSAVLIKGEALFVISSMLLGFLLLVLTNENIINFRLNSHRLFERFRYSFEGIVTFFLGCYILITPEVSDSWYMLSCGYLLLIDAIFETLKMLRDRKRVK